MRIATYEDAARLVQRYAVSRGGPLRYLGRPGQRWDISLEGLRVRTQQGRELATRLTMPCVIEHAHGEAWSRAVRIARTKQAIAAAKAGLARQLLEMFQTKVGVPGVRGWFQCAELLAIYSPVRRTVIRFDRGVRTVKKGAVHATL